MAEEDNGPTITNPDQFKLNLNEWIQVKKHLAEARKDIQILNKREKELKTIVGETMASSGTDRVNLASGAKINFKEKKTKSTVTKDVVAEGIKSAFPNNVTEQERILQCIEDSRSEKTVRSVTLCGLK